MNLRSARNPGPPMKEVAMKTLGTLPLLFVRALRAVGRAALVTILAALMPMGLSDGKTTRLELGLQSAIAASKAFAASGSGPLILSLSDNPGPGESPGPPVRRTRR
jgi:hypothetical protein